MSINSNLEFAANVGQFGEMYSKRWIENKIQEQETRQKNGKAVSIPKELLVSKQELQELEDYYKQYDNIINKLKGQTKYTK